MADPLQDQKADARDGKRVDPPFEKILNFRDVGKTINSLLGQKYIVFNALHLLTAYPSLDISKKGKFFALQDLVRSVLSLLRI